MAFIFGILFGIGIAYLGYAVLKHKKFQL